MTHVNLVFDGIKIRTKLFYEPHTGKYLRYSDYGMWGNLDDKEESATKGLVFHIVSLK